MAENVNIGASPLDAANLTTEVSGAQQAMETPQTGAIVKGPTVKGGISVPGNVALDPTQTAELLANMQAMIDKRTGGWNEFMSGMQDTLALATPQRLGGPTQAMAQRAATKRQEQEDIFNMRAQMASLKAGQAQAANQRAIAEQILGGQAGGAGGAPQGVFGGGINIPQEIKAAYALDPVNGAAMLNKFLTTAGGERTKAQFNPAWGALTEVIDNQGQIAKVPLWQAVDLAMQNPDNPTNKAVIRVAQETPGAPTGGGVNQYNVGNVRPAGQSTGFQQPKSFDEGLQIMDNNLKAYGTKHGVDTLRGVISRWAPPSENDTEALIKAASQRLGISPDQKIDLSNPAQRQAVGTALMLQEKGPKQLFAAAPTATRTDVGGGAMPPRAYPGEGAESLKIRQEEWKKEQETRRKGLGTQVEETSKFMEGLNAAAEAAPAKLAMLKSIKDFANTNPNAFYISGQTKGKEGVMGAMINYARDQGGEQKAKDREESIAPYFLTKDVVKKRKDIDAAAGQLAMGSSREMVGDASLRLGAQIEKMFIDFKGLGTSMPAETNKRNAEMYEVLQERKQRQAAAAKEYIQSNPTATPNEIRNSPKYKAVDDWASDRMVQIYGKKAEVTQQDLAREELRRRQEAKKGAQ